MGPVLRRSSVVRLLFLLSLGVPGRSRRVAALVGTHGKCEPGCLFVLLRGYVD